MTTKTSRVLIIGGYGAVGREAAAALATEASVVVAGRRPSQARPVPGTTAVRLDIADDAQLAAALDGADTVLMCPETGNARVARACLERGIGYVDVSATRSVLAEIEALDPVAERSGATAVLSVGIAPGVTNLLARYVSERSPGHPVRIGILLGSGERHGAAAVSWTIDGLGREQGSWPIQFPAPYGRRAVHRFPFSDQHTLGLPDVRTGLCLDSRPATALLGAANRPAVARFVHHPALRGLTERIFGGIHLGSDGFAVTVEAGPVRASFSGRGQSRATGLFAAHVIRLLPGLPSGVAHVERLVDPLDFLTELAAASRHTPETAPVSETGRTNETAAASHTGGTNETACAPETRGTTETATTSQTGHTNETAFAPETASTKKTGSAMRTGSTAKTRSTAKSKGTTEEFRLDVG